MESRYANSAEALKSVEDGFNYWSGKLTESSFQLCIALIAANWAVYQGVDKIKDNVYALWSIGLVLVTFAISLISAKRMGEAHREQYERAETAVDDWDRQYQESLGKRSAWPFTEEIENLGWVARELKTYLPLASGAIFLYGVVFN